VFRTPWLGSARGYLSDWVTQRWVELTGRRVSLEAEPWLEGPIGDTQRIGPDFFEELGQRSGLVLRPSAEARGLMQSFTALAGDGFDPLSVHPGVRDFYEDTARYRLDVWSEWSGVFRPFGRLLAPVFSRRLEQLNVPLAPLATRYGMASTVLQLVDPRSGAVVLTGWVRRNPATGETVYVGSYSVVHVPGHAAPCIKVVFPLPNGNATVILRPSVEPGGGLLLSSSGERFGDPGFYFVVSAGAGHAWVRHIRTFRESIHVYVDAQQELRTDHVFMLWGVVFLKLHYRLSASAA
jgi:hypothetical protein